MSRLFKLTSCAIGSFFILAGFTTTSSHAGASHSHMTYRSVTQIVTLNTKYCAAACTSASGTPNTKASEGASARLEVEAQENAREATEAKYQCPYGIVDLGCEQEMPNQPFDSMVACTSGAGVANLKMVFGGKGSSQLQARTLARQAASQLCPYSIIEVEDSVDPQATYCDAACTKGSGQPDTRFTHGERGRSKADAMTRALQETQRKFACPYEVQILTCVADGD